MREGVLCWYPFCSETTVLDMSGGVLTEMLRKRCAQVSVPCDDSNDAYDYTVVLDPDDFSVEALRSLRVKLNSHGRLLLAYENPFALRYWSGKRSPATGLPYDSLFGHGKGVSKAELSIRLKLAGFEGQKWYYPLTDHWFTREVYSENYLPNEHLNQRFMPYVADDISLQFDERWLYREVIRGGAFEFMCGAYLVEARVCGQDEPCKVDYAAVTEYRESAKRFATTVLNNGFVNKVPLHEDGYGSIHKILSNHEELAQMGINVVPLHVESNALVIPRIELPTLWDYWVKKLLNGVFDENEMFSQFDRIRDIIFQSAKTGKCYWELVPANCFYDVKNDEMIFFDQEYFWENVSPDVAIARAISSIKYSHALSADPRADKWLGLLKERYNLSANWENLLRIIDDLIYVEIFGDGTYKLIESTERVASHMIIWHRYWRFYPAGGKLSSLNFKHPMIYGYGKRGKVLHEVFLSDEINVAAIYDRGLTVDRSLEEIVAETTADVIIVSIFDSEDIAEDIRSRVSIPVFTLEELLNDCTRQA